MGRYLKKRKIGRYSKAGNYLNLRGIFYLLTFKLLFTKRSLSLSEPVFKNFYIVSLYYY